MPGDPPVSISRRGFLCASAGLLIEDDPRRKVLDVLEDFSRALGAGDPYDALAFVDRSATDYARLSANVTALLDQNEVVSSIRLGPVELAGETAVIETDWLLEIRSRQPAGGTVRRRADVTIRFALRKKKWRIVEVRPPDFLAAPVR